ncbi:MAG: VOC family protein [Synechococcaceae cyanobacterium]|nr:VOC family protein [Synechococcaceae cyanobacterium]
MALPQILSFGFSCADAEPLAAFYTETLGFRRGETLLLEGAYAALVGLPGSRLKLVRLHVGAETLELCQVLELGPGLQPGRPVPPSSRSNDLWFQHICLVSADLEAAAAPLQQELAAGRLHPISSAPQTLPRDNPSAAGIRAFKLRDPEGHPLELLQFPADKGEPRWHAAAAAGSLLGIDHSAIGVADSERSGRFYEHWLGLRRVGDGINQGPEQDRLDGLEGTRVRITAHRCAAGPGIECLHYLLPRGGRPMPNDQGAADAAHWQIRLAVNDLEALAAGLVAAGGRAISGGPMALEPALRSTLGFGRALQVRDPDGHVLQLVSD